MLALASFLTAASCTPAQENEPSVRSTRQAATWSAPFLLSASDENAPVYSSRVVAASTGNEFLVAFTADGFNAGVWLTRFSFAGQRLDVPPVRVPSSGIFGSPPRVGLAVGATRTLVSFGSSISRVSSGAVVTEPPLALPALALGLVPLTGDLFAVLLAYFDNTQRLATVDASGSTLTLSPPVTVCSGSAIDVVATNGNVIVLCGDKTLHWYDASLTPTAPPISLTPTAGSGTISIGASPSEVMVAWRDGMSALRWQRYAGGAAVGSPGLMTGPVPADLVIPRWSGAEWHLSAIREGDPTFAPQVLRVSAAGALVATVPFPYLGGVAFREACAPSQACLFTWPFPLNGVLTTASAAFSLGPTPLALTHGSMEVAALFASDAGVVVATAESTVENTMTDNRLRVALVDADGGVIRESLVASGSSSRTWDAIAFDGQRVAFAMKNPSYPTHSLQSLAPGDSALSTLTTFTGARPAMTSIRSTNTLVWTAREVIGGRETANLLVQTIGPNSSSAVQVVAGVPDAFGVQASAERAWLLDCGASPRALRVDTLTSSQLVQPIPSCRSVPAASHVLFTGQPSLALFDTASTETRPAFLPNFNHAGSTPGMYVVHDQYSLWRGDETSWVGSPSPFRPVALVSVGHRLLAGELIVDLTRPRAPSRLWGRWIDLTPVGLGAACELNADCDSQTCDAGLCVSPAPDAGLTDAGLADAGLADAGLADAGLADAGLADAGLADAGPADAGTNDAGAADAGMTDAGANDAGGLDAGSPDAGRPDAGTSDSGGFDSGSPDAGLNDGGPATGGAAQGCGCASGGESAKIFGLVVFIALRPRRRPRGATSR